MNKELFFIVDTIGEGNPHDPASFHTQRQRDLTRALALPLSTVIERWCAVDLTSTKLAYAPGERSIPLESVYEDELHKIE